MSRAPDAWTAPTALKGDEFQVWLHTDKAERMYRREEAVLFVTHKDLDRIDHRQNEGDGESTTRDVTEEFCRDWLKMQSHYLTPRYISDLVKQHADDWEKINNSKPGRHVFSEAAE